MVLLRRMLGDVLRRHRLRQSRTLREVAAAARVSLGYLSEVERGQKEASSELLAAICHALGVRLSDVLREVSEELALSEAARVPLGIVGRSRPAVLEPVLTPAEPVRTTSGERILDPVGITGGGVSPAVMSAARAFAAA